MNLIKLILIGLAIITVNVIFWTLIILAAIHYLIPMIKQAWEN